MSSMADLTTICVKFPPDDLAVLHALADHERLRRSDVIRRAIRAYAKQLGVSVEPKRPKPRQKTARRTSRVDPAA